MSFNLKKGLVLAGSAALSLLMWSGGPNAAVAQGLPYCNSGDQIVENTPTGNYFQNLNICAYAWQSVAESSGGGTVAINAGPTITVNVPNGTGIASFIVTFSVPASNSWTWQNPSSLQAISQTPAVCNLNSQPVPTQPSPTSVSYNVVTTGTAYGNCSIELGGATVIGATALAAPTYACNTWPNSDPNFLLNYNGFSSKSNYSIGQGGLHGNSISPTCQGTPPDEIQICVDITQSSGLAVSMTPSPCALEIVYALSSSQLGVLTSPPPYPLVVNIGAVNEETLCLGSGWESQLYESGNNDNGSSGQSGQDGVNGACMDVADIGDLTVFLNDYGRADNEGIYLPLTPSATLQLYGNYSGIAAAYLSEPASTSPTDTGNSCPDPLSSVTGNNSILPTNIDQGNGPATPGHGISGNTATLSIDTKGPAFVIQSGSNQGKQLTTNDVVQHQEICIYAPAVGSTNTPVMGNIIGANFNGWGGPANPIGPTPPGTPGAYSNTSSPLVTMTSTEANGPPGGNLGPTTTYQNTLSNVLAGYGYNGILQPINSAWGNSNLGLSSYVRIVNNTAQPIQVFADIQGDGGSLGTTIVESALPGNTNDYVGVQTLVANAGVTPGPNGHVSLVLAIPFPNPTISNNDVNTVNPNNGSSSNGLGTNGACTPSTVSNANQNFGAINGLCFVGIEQLVGEPGGIWLNVQ